MTLNAYKCITENRVYANGSEFATVTFNKLLSRIRVVFDLVLPSSVL